LLFTWRMTATATRTMATQATSATAISPFLFIFTPHPPDLGNFMRPCAPLIRASSSFITASLILCLNRKRSLVAGRSLLVPITAECGARRGHRGRICGLSERRDGDQQDRCADFASSRESGRDGIFGNDSGQCKPVRRQTHRGVSADHAARRSRRMAKDYIFNPKR